MRVNVDVCVVKGFGGAHARFRDMYTAILPPNVVRQACVRFAGVARVWVYAHVGSSVCGCVHTRRVQPGVSGP